MTAIELVLQNIPAALAACEQWVNWRLETRDGKPTKPPYNSRTGRKAACDSPRTWNSLKVAVQALEQGSFDGIGFMFAPDDGLAFIDLDHCRDPVTGDIEPWGLDVVERLNSYTEISPSGTGLHIFARGVLPDRGRQLNGRGGAGLGKIEMYDRARYSTITGWLLEGSPSSVEARDELVSEFYAELFPPHTKESGPSRPTNRALDLDDAGLLEKARGASNGAKFERLWAGDTSEYNGDESRADLALLSELRFWTGGDASRMDRLFRQSGLYREKWERADYRERTIDAAMDGDTYSRDVRTQPPSAGTPHMSKKVSEPPKLSHPTTDRGNAWRLVERFGSELLYCKAWGDWLFHDGRRWKLDGINRVIALASDIGPGIYQEAADAETKEQREGLAKWAHASESDAKVKSMISLARAFLPVEPGDFDRHPWLLNVRNGTLDLRTGQLRDHRRDDFITKIVDVDYQPDAGCPRWLTFLERVLPDEDVRHFIRRALGYSATGSHASAA